jgi:hypothetical protein
MTIELVFYIFDDALDMVDILDCVCLLRVKNPQCCGHWTCLHLQMEWGEGEPTLVAPLERTSFLSLDVTCGTLNSSQNPLKLHDYSVSNRI